MGKGAITFRCACGHKMNSNTNTLNNLKSETYWICSKCGRQYQTILKTILIRDKTKCGNVKNVKK